MPDFGIMRGFNEKLFGDKLVAGQLPTQLGLIGSQSTFVGLLDTYPNAAAAYSLRKLTTLFTGSAIRVRRSSDNAEQNIGFTALGDLDTTALTTFCSGTNGFVTTWYDQSGNGLNAVQTTAASQPQIVSSGSIISISSKPTLQFDGVDDRLKTASFSSIPQPITLFLLNKWITTNLPTALGEPHLIDLGLDRAISLLSSKNSAYFGGRINSTIGAILTQYQFAYLLANGVNSQFKINNETVVSGNIGTGTATQVTIGQRGQNYFANSFYSEFIVYNSNQSSNAINIQNNTNLYYGI
jgi:hypothetical protein